jgi:hypothetical protein
MGSSESEVMEKSTFSPAFAMWVAGAHVILSLGRGGLAAFFRVLHSKEVHSSK